MTDDKIFRIGKRHTPPDPDRALVRPVPYTKCLHPRFIVDEKLAQVECAECGEFLNPMWVLTEIARKESMLAQKRDRLRQLVKQLSDKVRYKCRHCGTMNDMARVVKVKMR